MKISLTEQLSSTYLNARELLAQDFFIEPCSDELNIGRFMIPNTYRLVIVNGRVHMSLTTCPQDLLTITDEGFFLEVASKKVIEQPVHIINLHQKSARPALQEVTFFINLDDHAKITILEEHVSVDEGCYLNAIVTDIQLASSACLTYYKLQRDSLQGYHLATTTVTQQADSALHYFVVSHGAKINCDDLRVMHREQGSFAELNGLFYVRGNSQVIQHTRADHFGQRCTTQQQYRGVAADQARGVFDGQMIVHSQAFKSSVHQSNHNLLLSNDAEIDTKPTLEIYVDDVSASHGATVGQLDSDALFYCQSRGVSLDDAKRLLVAGFVNTLFDDITPNPISKYVKQVVNEGL